MSTPPVNSPIDSAIDELWERRDGLSPADEVARKTVVTAVDQLDAGEARVAWVDAATNEVVVDERAKRAILLSFKVLAMGESHAGDFHYHDRMPLKTRFNGVRVVPGAIARWGSYQAPGVVLMPSFVNIGGYVGAGSMVDTWATVGSCAQVGERVHLSGGVGLGGVLEPPNAIPVVVEDDAFVGSRSMVVDGARVRRGGKLGAGSILTATTRVFDATSGDELPRGEVPERAVVVGASKVRSFAGGEFAMPCLLVLRTLAEGEIHDKLALNDALREHGVAT
jgi:2,3,4,5-tetrahydropyridine-2-carboxylate N-succinyltransferase